MTVTVAPGRTGVGVGSDTDVPANGHVDSWSIDKPSSAPPSASLASPTARRIIRRDGSVTPFDPSKIAVAMTKAFLAVEGTSAESSRRVHEAVALLTTQVVGALTRDGANDRILHIEDIQDQVELALMRGGHQKVARAYVLYREERARLRREATGSDSATGDDVVAGGRLHVRDTAGNLTPLDQIRIVTLIADACAGLDGVSPDQVLREALRNLYDGATQREVDLAPVMAARSLVEREPAYSLVSARLMLDSLRSEALSAIHGNGLPVQVQVRQAEMAERYAPYFADYLRRGVDLGMLDPELLTFDLTQIGAALRQERDLQFQFLGLQTLYDRYLIQSEGVRLELPQAFFMRVAMGLALREIDREARAIEFYNLLSSFDFMASTPTLFNAGTTRPQLSSCFLTSIPDDLNGIFSAVKDNALLSKFAGGLGNSWTRVRGMGAHIKGTNGQSQGIVPFLKVANDTAIAVNQGGKRKGAVCAYLETWHIDIEEFLDLRKNTGDDRRRTHDMNTANWVPDLFMQRVMADELWTLFSPDETPDLHDLYGPAFAERYVAYEEHAARGDLRVSKQVRASDLWRRMLTMLFETGHPWITFKDACNLRSPQQHAGVVHSSNLCTEITLNTSDEEVAVCNLGSVNLAQHVGPDGLDHAHLQRTLTTAMRMLDNVIDVNYYTIPQTRRSNLRHRPVGLGIMGFQDALYAQRLPYGSDAVVQFADTSMEAVSYYAIAASSDLAAERGRYASYDGSLWSRGILPLDSIALLAEARGGANLDLDRSSTLDWDALRERVLRQGMRNSNVMAIAPTATIANICGVSQSIEPTFRNLYVKSNMSGDFTVVNPHLVADLKTRGLWDEVMVADLKYYDGSLGQIDRVPDDLRALYATAFELDSRWLIEAAARRQKWIDQSQSLNLYIAVPSGRKLDQLYRLAWTRGLKTTYYLRSQGASSVEKSTLRGTDGKLNAVAVSGISAGTNGVAADAAPVAVSNGNGTHGLEQTVVAVAAPPLSSSPPTPASAPQMIEPEPPRLIPENGIGMVCSLDDPTCEACQ